MLDLGFYYQDKKHKYTKAEKYYFMAYYKSKPLGISNKDYIMSIAYLGFFYDSIKFNYKKMKKFYKMSIEYGDF